MSVWTENGYFSRHGYLESVAEEMGVPFSTVHLAAQMFGIREDFKGSLEDANTQIKGWCRVVAP